MDVQIEATNPPNVSPAPSPFAVNPFGLRRAAYSVNETLEILSLGRTSLYALVRAGKLEPRKIGRKTLFLAPDITRFLLELQRGGA